MDAFHGEHGTTVVGVLVKSEKTVILVGDGTSSAEVEVDQDGNPAAKPEAKPEAVGKSKKEAKREAKRAAQAKAAKYKYQTVREVRQRDRVKVHVDFKNQFLHGSAGYQLAITSFRENMRQMRRHEWETLRYTDLGEKLLSMRDRVKTINEQIKRKGIALRCLVGAVDDGVPKLWELSKVRAF